MNVVMLVLGHAIGDARVHKEAKTLAQAGYSVTVLAVQKEGAAAQAVQNGYAIERVTLRTRDWGLGSPSRALKYIEYALRTLWACWQLNADVYHAHDANTLPLAWLAARLRQAKLVYDAHEFEHGRNWRGSNLPKAIRRLWILQERLFIRNTDLVITVAPSIAAELSRIYALPDPTVVLNAPEPQQLRKTQRLREWLDIPADQPIILYQGAVTRGRGLHTLIEGAMQLPDPAVVVLGAGPYLEDVRAWVAQCGWKRRVYLPGRVDLDDLLAFTASADIGVSLIENVCQSYYYSLPNKLFEYLQAGIPVIVSNFPEMQRIAVRYGVGIAVDPQSPADLANALRLLLEQRRQYTQMQANAARAAAELNWSHEGEKLLAAYAALQPELTP